MLLSVACAVSNVRVNNRTSALAAASHSDRSDCIREIERNSKSLPTSAFKLQNEPFYCLGLPGIRLESWSSSRRFPKRLLAREGTPLPDSPLLNVFGISFIVSTCGDTKKAIFGLWGFTCHDLPVAQRDPGPTLFIVLLYKGTYSHTPASAGKFCLPDSGGSMGASSHFLLMSLPGPSTDLCLCIP